MELLLIGPPGTGKSLVARRIAGRSEVFIRSVPQTFMGSGVGDSVKRVVGYFRGRKNTLLRSSFWTKWMGFSRQAAEISRSTTSRLWNGSWPRLTS
jgi:hypothetical protein